MKHTLSASIDVGDARKAESAVVAISHDRKENRSKISIRRRGTKIIFKADAEDETAMRSAINTNLRLIGCCLHCLELR